MDYNRLVDDITKMAGNTLTSMVELKNEIEKMIRKGIESAIKNLDIIKRDEFNATKKMAQLARTEQQLLEKRITVIEKKLGIKPPASKKNLPKKTTKTQVTPKKKAASTKVASAKKVTKKTESITSGKPRGNK